MSWVRLDDQFFAHPKIVDLPKDAKLLYLSGLTYCAAQLTDGRLTAGAVRMLGALVDVESTAPLVTALLTSGLWEVCEGGWQIHDYLEYNPSAEKVKAEREATAQRVHTWRDKKRATRNATSNSVTYPSEQPPDVTDYVTEDVGVCNVESNGVTHGVGNGVRNGHVTVPPAPTPSPNNITSGSTTARDPAALSPRPPTPISKRADQPSGFVLTPQLRAWAAEHEPSVDVEAEASAFLDHALATGKVCSDWAAAFRLWLRKAPGYAQQQARGQPRAAPTARATTLRPLTSYLARQES